MARDRIRTGQVEFTTSASSQTRVSASVSQGADFDCGLPPDHDVLIWTIEVSGSAVKVDAGAGRGKALDIDPGYIWKLGESPNGHVYPRELVVFGTGGGAVKITAQVVRAQP